MLPAPIQEVRACRGPASAPTGRCGTWVPPTGGLHIPARRRVGHVGTFGVTDAGIALRSVVPNVPPCNCQPPAHVIAPNRIVR